MELEKAGAGCVNKNDPRKCRYISLQKRLCSLRSSFIWWGGIPTWENTLMVCRHFRQIDVTEQQGGIGATWGSRSSSRETFHACFILDTQKGEPQGRPTTLAGPGSPY